MLDDTSGGDGKQRVTPKPAPPAPVVTIMSDGSLKVLAPQIPLLELNRLLLVSANSLTERTVQRAAAMEHVLLSVQARFEGFDEDTANAMAQVLGKAPSG